MSFIPLQMECHWIIKLKEFHRKVLLWQPTLLTVGKTFLCNILIMRSNHYITLVNTVWSTVVKIWSNNIHMWKEPVWSSLQMNINFLHSVFTFIWMICQSLWCFINTVWPYHQSCMVWNIQICQQFQHIP